MVHPVSLSRPVDAVGYMVQRRQRLGTCCAWVRGAGACSSDRQWMERMRVYNLPSLRTEYCQEGRLISEDKERQVAFSVPGSRSQ